MCVRDEQVEPSAQRKAWLATPTQSYSDRVYKMPMRRLSIGYGLEIMKVSILKPHLFDAAVLLKLMHANCCKLCFFFSCIHYAPPLSTDDHLRVLSSWCFLLFQSSRVL